jgi:DNA-binding IclR family transcriptional regulator
MLANALDILRLLAEAEGPLTATAIAERIGLHPSNVSRTLRVLIEAGYVRKPSYHSFAPDLGLLALAGSMARSHPLCVVSQPVVEELSNRLGLTVTLAGLFQEQIVYLQTCQPGGSAVMAGVTRWPLHRSVVALRLLLDLPKKRALALLEASRRRYGWERPTAAVPETPAACLEAARVALQGEALWLRGWNSANQQQVAIALSIPGQPALALACDGRPSDEHIIIEALHDGAARLSAALEDHP